MGIHVQETYVNLDRDMTYDMTEIYESFSDNVGELFRAFRKESGRCIGKIYVDLPDGKVRACGWVFQQKAKYEDTGEPYIRETWVSLYEKAPVTTVETFPLYLDKE